jgi:hypothetical protein
MKNIFIILSLGLLFSCNPDDPQPQQQPQEVNWKFEFSLNGVTHKAQGVGVSPDKNSAYSLGLTQVYLGIKDQSDQSYISGNNGDMVIQFLNPSVGIQSLDKCSTFGSWWTDLEQNGINVFGGYSLSSGGTQVTNSNGGLGPALPINITNLGTSGNGSWLGGSVFKGTYNGTLYFPSLNQWPIQYNIPVSVNLNFEAARQ